MELICFKPGQFPSALIFMIVLFGASGVSYGVGYGVRGGAVYPVDDSHGLGRRFDGLGAISGGGVSWNNCKPP